MASKPQLTETGELIIPSDSPVEYRWCFGGQSVKETLEELKAPEDVVNRYIDQKKGLKS